MGISVAALCLRIPHILMPPPPPPPPPCNYYYTRTVSDI